MTRMDYAAAVLRGLGVEFPRFNVGSRRGLVVVMYAESGPRRCDGTDGAAWNPLNTTLKLPGSTLLKGNTAGVQNYLSFDQGVAAVVATLVNTGGYEELIAKLVSPTATAKGVLMAWGKSPWGTPLALMDAVLDEYQLDRKHYNTLPVG